LIHLQTYGFDESLLPNNHTGIPARITAVHKERFELACEHGILYGRLKTSVYYGNGDEDFPTVGDFVLIQRVLSGDSRIIKTLPRKTYFSRRNPDRGCGEQSVAANFDTVLITTSLNHDLNLNRVERYLTITRQSGALPVIILTKADLLINFDEQVRKVQSIAPGVDIVPVSIVSGLGVDRLDQYLQPGKTVVFLGSSGVGKSSLVNALYGDTQMKVNAIREEDSRGRHTTTHRQLFMLPSGAMVIDTPGMRELGMWDVRVGLGENFGDVEQFFSQCRFSDCHHQSEPGCAVKEAIKHGQLSSERFETYLRFEREARNCQNKPVKTRSPKPLLKPKRQNKKEAME
jgi:ribosome biogenesis GTPase